MIATLLKNHTLSWHQKVEELNPLLGPDFTLEHYKIYLQNLAGYYEEFEKQLRPWTEKTPSELNLKNRFKLASLISDLEALGGTSQALSFQVPPIKTAPQFWGHLYVLEGSTLGGQIISRKLAERLPLNPHQLQFFNSYKENTGPMWKSFIQNLNAQNFSEAEQQEVLDAANEGFKSYGRLLQQIQKDTEIAGLC